MAKRLQLFRCEVCGQMTMVFNEGGGTLACCGQSMVHMAEGVTDAAREKHVPVVEKVNGGYLVKVGQVAHPMADEHYIRWVELLADGKFYCQFLKPGEAPEAFFDVQAENAVAREYCNLHGYWKGE